MESPEPDESAEERTEPWASVDTAGRPSLVESHLPSPEDVSGSGE